MPLTKIGRWTLFGGTVLTLELAGIGYSYAIWTRCNNSQEYRRWMYEHHPRILDAFYLSCEVAGVHFVKQKDLKEWGIKDRTYPK